MMLVNFGVCINELGVDCRLSTPNDAFSRLLFYVDKKLEYSLNKCNEYYLHGFRHMRLPNLLPPDYDQNDFSQLLKIIRMNNRFKLFSRLNASYSFHLPYKLGVKTYTDRLLTVKYIRDLNRLMCVIGVTRFSIVCHVKDKSISNKNKFLKMLSMLPTRFKKSVVIENDEYHSSLHDCISLSNLIKLPCVYDNLHNKLNGNIDFDVNVAEDLLKTWKCSNLTTKIHYSSHSINSNNGHGNFIDDCELLEVLEVMSLVTDKVVVMLEIKDCLRAIEAFMYRTRTTLLWKDYIGLEI